MIAEPPVQPGPAEAERPVVASPDPDTDSAQEAVAPAVKKLLAEPFLTEAERRELRLKHGIWTAADLDTPQARAYAAVIRGDYLDSALGDESVSPLVRAEAMIRRGELEEAIALIAGDESPRGRRLRVEALWSLGRYGDVRAEASKFLADDGWAGGGDADAIADGVRALAVLTRVRDQKELKAGDNAASFRSLMGLLARAREQADRMSWSARLGEARLLDEKDNLPEAGPALQQALMFNPSSAEGWALAGYFAVEQFNLEQAELVAQRLDAIAAGVDVSKVEAAALAPSYQGAIVRARARLRASDGPGAEQALGAVLAKYPRSRELLALQAAASAARFEENRTAELLKAFDSISPGSAEAYLEVGRVLSSERQYADAAGYLEEAARRAPAWADPFTELGLLEVQSGRDDRALAALEKAVALDPFNTRAGNSLKLVQELRTFSQIESDHFIVRYKPGVDEVLAEEMPALLEEMFRRVTGAEAGGIQYEPPGRTVIELMPDHHWFSVRITGMPRVHTIAASTGPVVAMETPKEGPGHLVGPYDWLRVVRHEFTHTVTLSRTRNRLPHWFTEAAAVYLEDAPREDSTCQLLARALETGTLFDLDDINTAFVRPKKQTDRSQAYAQGHWMYEYIVERWGPKAPLDLMDRYAAGERESAAMQSVLGLTREQFLEQFKEWGKGRLIAWGINPPEGTPNVRELLRQEAEAAKAAGTEPAESPTKELVGGWLAKYPEHPEVLKLAVAYELERTGGRADEAMVPLLERCAKARPVDSMPQKLLARYYLDREGGPDSAAAIPHLEFLDVREQHSASYAMELARCYAAVGDWTNAWAKALRATRVDPFNPAARELAASVALKRSDLPAAEHQVIALTKLEPDREIHRKRLEAIRAKKGS
ncbi:MAG: hypothetical protein IT436_16345 [Phycisphaerales bacterium]|nr:hypothetical protein [Phycisphaerales bacterium]